MKRNDLIGHCSSHLNGRKYRKLLEDKKTMHKIICILMCLNLSESGTCSVGRRGNISQRPHAYFRELRPFKSNTLLSL